MMRRPHEIRTYRRRRTDELGPAGGGTGTKHVWSWYHQLWEMDGRPQTRFIPVLGQASVGDGLFVGL